MMTLWKCAIRSKRKVTKHFVACGRATRHFAGSVVGGIPLTFEANQGQMGRSTLQTAKRLLDGPAARLKCYSTAI
jgi:hypothetical protein